MTPEEPTPKPGIRYGGLMCPHGMVRGACAICRNPPASPKLEAESVEPEPAWIGTRLWLIEKNAALRAEVERLKGIIMGTSAESRVTLGVNLRRYWPAEAQVMLGRMLFDEDVPALRAELAAERAAREKAEKAAEAPRRPPGAEVRDLWERCRPITDDAQVRGWIESRALDAEIVAGLDLCRALPVSGTLPKWARYMGRSWRESSHRVIVPLFGAGGRMESLHARALAPASPKDKAASPAGDKAGPLEVRGLVMANETARYLLTPMAPGVLVVDSMLELARSENAWPAYVVRVVVAEGVPDFLTWAAQYAGGDGETVPPVFGVIAGSWTPEIAATIPNGSRVTIRTHHDDAGNKYAAKIRGTLEGRVTLLRSKAPENAGTQEL